MRNVLEHLQLSNLSGITVHDYGYMTKCFLKFLEDNQIKEREDISKKVLLDYQVFVPRKRTGEKERITFPFRTSNCRSPSTSANSFSRTNILRMIR